MAKVMPENNADHFLKYCVTAQFLIDDLRTVSDFTGKSGVEQMESLYWFRQHFNGGFGLATIAKKLDSGRKTNNEFPSNLGNNIRSVVQDIGLGLGEKSGAWGIDLYSLRQLNVMRMLGDSELSSNHFNKNTQYPTRCEHTDEVVDLRNMVRSRVLDSNDFGTLKESAKWFAENHLACAIQVSEDRNSKTQKRDDKNNQLQPFWRYRQAGVNILMDTGLEGPDRFRIVTNFTRPEIHNIRMANPKWQALIRGIENHPGFDQKYLNERRKDFHADNVSTHKNHAGQRSSSYYPELTDRNLKIIERNDPVELCREFYTWKIK